MQNNHIDVIPIQLLIGRSKAVELLERQIERGEEIAGRRIRSREDLDSARSEKNGWVTSNNELFRIVFTDPAPAEQYLAWKPAILPEYAELALFIEQFQQEMEQRLTRLGAILATVEAMPETGEGPVASASSAPDGHGCSSPCPPG
jgi:hypothetical protein